MSVEKPPSPPAPAVAAFEKVPFENDASILWKHVTARRFQFVYHYHPEILLFLPPALLLFTLFVTLPVAEAACCSFFNWNGYGAPSRAVGVSLFIICVRVMACYKRLFMREKAAR
jgi:ABC-type sugar transport system permease subunit